jgi:acetyl-CoA/propionyl-CoA carboxylase biotin carboxyl carrier protein
MAHDAFRAGQATTAFLSDYPDVVPAPAHRDENGPAADTPESPLALIVEVDGRRFATTVHGLKGPGDSVKDDGRRRPRRGASSGPALAAGGDDLISPIHGTVIRIDVEMGASVESGQVMCVVEAMKMENELAAHKSGTVTGLPLEVGSSVAIGQVVATIAS